jgi:putative transposase
LRPSPARALSPAECETVLTHLHGERFQDRSPAAVYATLLDAGEYLCSIRSMFGKTSDLSSRLYYLQGT